MILVKGLQVFRYWVLVVKALGHHKRHGMRQREARHYKKLEHVVKAGRVAHARLHNGRQLLDVAQGVRAEHALPGLHPSAVSAYGVYLAVVGQQAERLRQTPRRERVGGEARVYQGQSAGEVFVGEVGVILPQLEAREHTFIYDVLRRQRAHVEVLVGHAAFYALADEVQRALELRQAVVSYARNEELLDVGLARECGLAEAVGLRGHVAQVHQRQSFALYLLNHHAQYVLLPGGVLGQEHQSRAVLSLLRHGYSLQ